MNYRTVSCASALLLAAAAWAAACKVVNPNRTILQQAAAHDATIHGTVLKSEVGQVCNSTRRQLTLKVKKAFGSGAMPGDTVVLLSGPETAMCGVDYPVGTEVVIFSSKSQGCTQSPELLSTSEGDFNIANPAKPQLDSLYQGGPTSLSGSDIPVTGNGAIQARGRHGSGPVLFRKAGESGPGSCRADGRLLSP